jgi:DNA-binding response OmpR family regulator
VSTIGIPFHFFTASTEPANRSRAMELGAAAYFQKPYDLDELLSTIDKVLGAVKS